MSKSFKEKRSRERDFYDNAATKKTDRSFKKREKLVHNALRSCDINTLIKYSGEDDSYADLHIS
jgi:hypothetical protein